MFDFAKMVKFAPDDGVNDAAPVIDFSDFGADAQVIRDLYKNPKGIHNLLESKRKANAEAKAQRRIIENNAAILGVETDDMSRLSELYGMARTGALRYAELDEEDRELAEILVIREAVEPSLIGMDDEDVQNLEEVIESEFAFADDNYNSEEDEMDEPEDELDNELVDLEEELGYKQLILDLIKEGANPKMAEKLARLYDEPEYPEKYLDKAGQPMSEEAIIKEQQRLHSEYLKQFRAENPWGFGSAQAPPPTHGVIQPPRGNTTGIETAEAQGDILGMIKSTISGEGDDNG